MARVAVAGGMSFVLGVLLILDGVSEVYDIQPTTLTIVVTMIVVLLGIETANIWRKP